MVINTGALDQGISTRKIIKSERVRRLRTCVKTGRITGRSSLGVG